MTKKNYAPLSVEKCSSQVQSLPSIFNTNLIAQTRNQRQSHVRPSRTDWIQAWPSIKPYVGQLLSNTRSCFSHILQLTLCLRKPIQLNRLITFIRKPKLSSFNMGFDRDCSICQIQTCTFLSPLQESYHRIFIQTHIVYLYILHLEVLL